MTIPYPLLLLAIPLVGSPAAYLAGRALKSEGLARWLARILLLLDWIPWSILCVEFLRGDSKPILVPLQMLNLQIDGLSLLLSAAVLVLATAVSFYSGPYLAEEEGQVKYYALLLTLTGAIIGLGCATDLLNLWLWFEAMTVSTFFLVTFYHNQPASLEAGVKYLVQSAAGSALVLFGIALVFGDRKSVV